MYKTTSHITLLIAIIIPSLLYGMKIDHAAFKGTSEDLVLVELYYSFEDKGFQYNKTSDSTGVAEYSLETIISSKNGNSDTLSLQKTLNTIYEKSGLKYRNIELGTEKLYLEPGQYDITLNITQTLNNTKIVRDSDTKKISVPDLNSQLQLSNIAVSDYQFCFKIEQDLGLDKWNERFSKNSFYFIPLPTREYFGNSTHIEYYYEIYLKEPSLADSLVFTENLYDYTKTLIYDQKITVPASSSNGRIAKIPMNEQPTGVYYVSSTITDSKGNILANQPKSKVYLTNPDLAPVQNNPFYESLSFEKSVFSTFSEEEVETEFDKLTYVLNDLERGQFKQLTTLEGKQRALFMLYSIRDADTTTIFNEFFDEYSRRANYANNHFTYGNVREGWRTERGRVIMTYGIPGQRIELPRRGDKNPTEIWFYPNIQGGTEFYFVDQIGIGNFILVHSTAMNELQNPRWIEMYNPALDDTDLRRYQNSSRNYDSDFR